MQTTKLAGIWMIFLALALQSAYAARFTDTFSTAPGALNRKPFVWDRFNAYHGAGSVWQAHDGLIEYRTNKQVGTYCGLGFAGAGIDITDETRWSLETGFRHVSGAAPDGYMYIAYVRWYTSVPGRMRILGLSYDAQKRQLNLYNAVENEEPIPADLTGPFHAVRLTVSDGRARIYVDGKLVGGPYKLKVREYGAAKEFLFGPLTETKPHTLDCQWDYLAFTDEGAFPPGAGNWNPASDKKPVAEGLNIVQVNDVFNQPPYPGIKVWSARRREVSAGSKPYRSTCVATGR